MRAELCRVYAVAQTEAPRRARASAEPFAKRARNLVVRRFARLRLRRRGASGGEPPSAVG
jgi:hypothetical protein